MWQESKRFTWGIAGSFLWIPVLGIERDGVVPLSADVE